MSPHSVHPEPSQGSRTDRRGTSMEPPAKRPRLAGDTGSDAGQLPEAPRSQHNSDKLSNNFEGYGVQNTGRFEAGRDVVIHVDKRPNTSVKVDRRRALLESLEFEQMDAREWSIKKAHARTCAWFLATPEYVNWTHENALHNRHNFLWIKGKPGAGKSTLMKFLLRNLRNQNRLARSKELLLSFFFNARGHDLERSAAGLYRSLLLQLLEARTDLQYVLDKVRPGHRWSIESLKSVFEEAVQGLGDDSLIFIIDALDECEEEQIRDIVKFLSGPDIIRNRVRTCFASRHYPHVSVETAVEIVLESQSGHGEDIASYLSSALIIKDSPLAEQIRHDLQKKASGIFMWVVLVVNILNREYDAGRKHALRRRIQQLPDDLHELFRNILTRDDNNMDGLLLCIQWVLFAQQPLTPKQLYFAIMSGLEPDDLESCHADDISEDNIKKYILNNSKGLAESTRSKIPTVQFIHESVRDFLLKENGFSKIRPDFSANVSGQSHTILRQCCLVYMNMEALTDLGESSHEVVTRDFPFLEYANRGLLYHAEQAEIHNTSQRSFLDTFPRSRWVGHHKILEKNKVRRYTSEVSLLYILAEAGMSALIRALPKRQSCFEIEKERYGLPILAARATGSTAAIQTMLELEARQPTVVLAPNLHSLMSPSLDIQYAPTRTFTFKKTVDIMHQLMQHGDEHISLFFLLTQRCDIKAKGPRGETILISAVERKYSVLVKALLEMGADTEGANPAGWTPLHKAVFESHVKLASLLINAGANIEAADPAGWTPLHRAMSQGHVELASLLINAGANIEAADPAEQTPLYAAVSQGHIKLASLLINAGANIEAADYGGQRPLYKATFEGYVELASLLIDAGADIEAAGPAKWTPLYAAVSQGHVELASLLINAGANIEAADYGGQRPLYKATFEGHVELASLLIDAGADIEGADLARWTPLYKAVSQGYVELASLLINAGANIEAANLAKQTPLYAAVSQGYVELASLLINAGANIEAANLARRTPLHEAAFKGHVELASLLINAGANIEAADLARQRPLYAASAAGSYKTVEILIRYGADVSATEDHGRTPLFTASRWGNIDVVRVLIKHGSNVLTRDIDGHTPLSVAEAYGHAHVAEILINQGAQRE